MPNIKSAKKRVKVTETKTLNNRIYKTIYKNVIKKFEKAVAEGDKAAAQEAFREAVSKIDKAVSKGIVHANTAARKKSQFALKLNKLEA